MSKITIESPFRVALTATLKRQRNMGRFGAQARNALAAGVGTAQVPDVQLNVSSRTFHALKKHGCLPA